MVLVTTYGYRFRKITKTYGIPCFLGYGTLRRLWVSELHWVEMHCPDGHVTEERAELGHMGLKHEYYAKNQWEFQNPKVEVMYHFSGHEKMIPAKSLGQITAI